MCLILPYYYKKNWGLDTLLCESSVIEWSCETSFVIQNFIFEDFLTPLKKINIHIV